MTEKHAQKQLWANANSFVKLHYNNKSEQFKRYAREIYLKLIKDPNYVDF